MCVCVYILYILNFTDIFINLKTTQLSKYKYKIQNAGKHQ